MDRPRKAILEVATDLGVLRIEYDYDLDRVTIWRGRFDRENPERHEIQLHAEK